jgi:DNA polymerase-3 subunit alpha
MSQVLAVVFDTETSGLPSKDLSMKSSGVHPSPHKYWLYDNARIVQFAYMVVDISTGEVLREICCLVRPTGEWSMQTGAEQTHGMSFARVTTEGISLESLLKLFCEDCSRANFLVCHNTAFDLSVVFSEIFRARGMLDWAGQVLSKCKVFCTMKSMTEEMNLPYPNGSGRGKWPRLEELHRYLFDGETFEGAHDALCDIRATTRCFLRILERRELSRCGQVKQIASVSRTKAIQTSSMC